MVNRTKFKSVSHRFACVRVPFVQRHKRNQKVFSLKITHWSIFDGYSKPEYSLFVERESAEEKSSLALIYFSCLPADS